MPCRNLLERCRRHIILCVCSLSGGLLLPCRCKRGDAMPVWLLLPCRCRLSNAVQCGHIFNHCWHRQLCGHNMSSWLLLPCWCCLADAMHCCGRHLLNRNRCHLALCVCEHSVSGGLLLPCRCKRCDVMHSWLLLSYRCKRCDAMHSWLLLLCCCWLSNTMQPCRRHLFAHPNWHRLVI